MQPLSRSLAAILIALTAVSTAPASHMTMDDPWGDIDILDEPDGADPVVYDFNGAVQNGQCKGVWSFSELDAEALVDLLHALAPIDGEGLTGPLDGDGAAIPPVAVDILIAFAFFVLSEITHPDPPPDSHEYWRYECSVDYAKIYASGRGGTFRRVAIEAHDTQAHEYVEVGVPCEYSGLPDHDWCEAFYEVPSPQYTETKEGVDHRPDTGELCFDTEIRAVNSGQHAAFENLPVIGRPAVINPDGRFQCLFKTVEWCHVDTQDCAGWLDAVET